jgi:hypothetical protein
MSSYTAWSMHKKNGGDPNVVFETNERDTAKLGGGFLLPV